MGHIGRVVDQLLQLRTFLWGRLVAVVMLDAFGRAVGEGDRGDHVGHVGRVLGHVGVLELHVAALDEGIGQSLHVGRVDVGRLRAGNLDVFRAVILHAAVSVDGKGIDRAEAVTLIA